MNEDLKNSIAQIARLLPFKMLRGSYRYPPFLPFYHVVSDEKLPYINSYRVRTAAEFEKELDYLLRYFDPVSLENIIEKPDNRKMHLSFDDGLEECYSIIAPILKRKGIPATFFVSPGFVDNKKLFHRFKRSILEADGVLERGGKKYFFYEEVELDKLAAKHGIDFPHYEPYMSMEQLSSLHNDGFLIGGHSMAHPEMWKLSEDEQLRHVSDTMQWLEEHFHPEMKAFAFPFTDDGLLQPFFARLKKSGIVDATFGTSGLKPDSESMNYQRVPVELRNWSVQKTLHFEYFYYFVRSLTGKNEVKH
ncbi:MAG: polysaccharide deacetylase family protein [Prolixibacteraceae bacterium]|jgi:peptidoglycan/xylan/chitin deacetylase (PgdA/CDA1 family)|nr:polysaccharide deacetylase family protein [Prolixibacteraceae bacterium]